MRKDVCIHVYIHIYKRRNATLKKSDRETHREIEGKKRVHKRKSVRENMIL